MKRLLAAIVAALLALTGALITSPASASPTTGFECYVHQGESRNGPHGNTAAAFRAGVRYHTDIETDLRVTKNGVPVIFHDPHMWDVAGHDRTDLIRNYTWRQINRMHYRGGGDLISWQQGLAASRGAAVLAELKVDVNWSRTRLTRVVRAINQAHATKRVFLYTSNWQVISRIEANWPRIRTILRMDYTKGFQFVKANGVLGHAAYWTKHRVRAATRAGKLVYVREQPTQSRLDQLKRWGADGVIVPRLEGRSRCR